MRSTLRIAALATLSFGSSPVFGQSGSVTLTPADTDPKGAIDQLAKFVGQRVRIPLLTAVAPSDGSSFYGVINGLDRPFRGPGLAPNVTLPDGLCCAVRFQGNPELLQIDSSAVSGITVSAGAVLSEVTGVLDNQNGTYRITLDSTPGVSEAPSPVALRLPDPTEFTVSSLQPTGSVDTDAAIAHNRLHDPDVLTVASNAATLADALNALQQDAGYQAFGDQLLVRTARLSVSDVQSIGSFTLARISALQPATEASKLSVIVARFPQTDSSSGLDVQQARKTEAEALAKLVDDRQSRGERVIVTGDFEAYQFGDGFVDVVGTVRGVPSPAGQVLFDSPSLVQTPLINLVDRLPAGEQYSATAAGDAVAVDHILASASLSSAVTGFGFARGTADTPGDGVLSHRDQPMGYVSSLAVTNLSDATAQVAPSAVVTLSPGSTSLTISIVNFSRAAAKGPFHLYFPPQTGSYSIANALGLLNGLVLSLPSNKASLSPGESYSVTINSVNPGTTPLTIPVKVLSGTLP